MTHIYAIVTYCSDAAAARNAFNAFDKKSEERIKVGDIEATMKKLGHSIKSGWLEKIESSIDTEGYNFTLCSIELNIKNIHIQSRRKFVIRAGSQ